MAGSYQFMPIKNACLTHCKTPLGFLLNEWQAGHRGAFNMGLKHGVNCLGCCWAQMLIMFAIGVMNLLGMAMITFLVIIEKTLPMNAKLISKIVGGIFLISGAFLLINM
jgi:predicted metal-binding membrane protein